MTLNECSNDLDFPHGYCTPAGLPHVYCAYFIRVCLTSYDIIFHFFGCIWHNSCAIHRWMFSTPGDTMSTPEGYHEYSGEYHDGCGGYHEYIEGCSVHRDFRTVLSMTFPALIMISPSVLVIFPRCTEHLPVYRTGIMQVVNYELLVGPIKYKFLGDLKGLF